MPNASSCSAQPERQQRDASLLQVAQTGTERLQLAEKLLAEGADATLTDSYGYTPLHWAARGGHLSCVQAILAESNVEVSIAVVWPGHCMKANLEAKDVFTVTAALGLRAS